MDASEILIGRHYKRSDWRYQECRKVLEIRNGRLVYVVARVNTTKVVKLATFAKWAGYLVPPEEPADPYTLFCHAAGTDVHHTYKPGRSFAMSYWYSLNGQATYAESPCMTGGDDGFLFDVRNLPEKYRDGLEIQVKCGLDQGHMSPLEACRRERAAHCAAISAALIDGFDILANERACREKQWAEDEDRNARALAHDDDFPF